MYFADERWLESLDMKIAALINLDGELRGV